MKQMLDFEKEKLDNGLRIITAPLDNTKAVTVLVMVKTGSRYEDKENNGIAHFLEHMFFKGTQKRPTTLDIARELDSVGAAYNAFTGEEFTGFYVRAESSHFDLALDILTDMLYNSRFDEKEIQKEKGVILEEINMIRDLPQSYVEYLMKELLYGDEPLGRMITGLPATVTHFNRQTFTSFFADFYQPQRIIVTVAGGTANHSSQSWTKKIKHVFEKKLAKRTPDFSKIKEKQIKPGLKVFHKTTDQAHFILGFRGFKYTDSRRPILKVLNNIMGATMSSRLFTEVREKRGLCYYVSSDIADFSDTGFWGASAGVDLKRVDEAIEVILDEFTKIKKQPVTTEELIRAKENLKGRLYLGLEESMNVSQFLAEQEMFWGKIKDPDQIVEETQKVTKEEVQKLANDLMRPEKLNLAIIGPFKDKEKLEKIINKFY